MKGGQDESVERHDLLHQYKRLDDKKLGIK